MNLQVLYGLWDELSARPLDDNGRLTTAFLHLSAGALPATAHRWFEQQNPQFDVRGVAGGQRRTIEAFTVVTIEEAGEGTRVLVHGVRFDRALAMDLARQVALDLKAAVEAELERDIADFQPLSVESTEAGYALMATDSLSYAVVEVRFAPAAGVVGEPYYSEPLSAFDEVAALVA